MRRVYEKSVEMAADFGLTSLSNYMLYNFMDTPSDLYRRMRINIALNERLGVQIWSFPMRYLPVTMKDRSHIGKNWNRYYLRSFQIMLQATHGVVSGSDAFFFRAFGSSYGEFEQLLSLPHAFIFHRDFYENGKGRALLDEYNALRRQLSTTQQGELVDVLSAALLERPRRDAFLRLASQKSLDRRIRQLAHFTRSISRHRESQTLARCFLNLLHTSCCREPDALVEDAGLYDSLANPPALETQVST